MKIEAKRVKCGDCIVLTEDKEKMVIDCGSDNRDGSYSSSEFAYSQLEKELKDDTVKQLVITHFDNDHYNGILEIKNPAIFLNTYIPMSFVRENETVLESFSWIVLIASDASWGIRLTKGIKDLFNKLFEITSGHVIPVQKGDTITYNGRYMKVLWPEVCKTCSSSRISSPFHFYESDRKDIIKAITGRISDSDNSGKTKDEEKSYNSEKPHASDRPDDLENMHETDKSYESEGLAEKINNAMDELKHSLVEVQESPISRNILRLNAAYHELRGLHKLLRDRYHMTDIHYRFYEQYLYAYHALINSMNATSVILEDGDDTLYLGDAPADIINYLKGNKDIKDYYKVVKLQHHATARYVTPNTPAADYYIVSNGGWESRRISRGFIDGICSKSKQILCTNGQDNALFCEYRRNKGVCNGKCTNMNVVHVCV